MAALTDWRAGRTSWEGWDASTQRSREAFARLVGVDARDVAVGSQVSALLAPIAAALPDGTRVLVPDVEFTSFVFPFVVHADRGVEVETVPTAGYLDAIRPGIDVVAFSLVQSSTGEVADYPAIVGGGPVGRRAGPGRRDPGMRLAAVRRRPRRRRLRRRLQVADVAARHGPGLPCPGAPGPAASDRGRLVRRRGPVQLVLRAADGARRRCAPVRRLARLVQLGGHGAHAGADRAHRTRGDPRAQRRIGQPVPGRAGSAAGDSAIVTVDVPGAQERLEAAGVRAAVRAGRVRASFHMYTTEGDVDLALDALTA